MVGVGALHAGVPRSRIRARRGPPGPLGPSRPRGGGVTRDRVPCDTCAELRGSHAVIARPPRRRRPCDEAHRPDPLPERGGDAPRDARRPPPRGPRLRRGRVAGHRRRLDRPHDRGRPRARRRPHRPPDEQQGPGRGLPGRAGRRAEARRRRRRQHRRRQPVPRLRTSCDLVEPIVAGTRRHGRRRPRHGHHRALLAAQEAPAEARLVRSCAAPRTPTCPTRPRASAPTTARRRCRWPSSRSSPTRSRRSSRPASCSSPPTTSRSRTNPQTRESRLFPSMGDLRAPQRAGDHRDLRPVRAAEGLPHARARALPRGARALRPLRRSPTPAATAPGTCSR